MKLYLDVHNSVAMAERRRWRRRERRAARALRVRVLRASLKACVEYFVTHQINRLYDPGPSAPLPSRYRKVFR